MYSKNNMAFPTPTMENGKDALAGVGRLRMVFKALAVTIIGVLVCALAVWRLVSYYKHHKTKGFVVDSPCTVTDVHTSHTDPKTNQVTNRTTKVTTCKIHIEFETSTGTRERFIDKRTQPLENGTEIDVWYREDNPASTATTRMWPKFWWFVFGISLTSIIASWVLVIVLGKSRTLSAVYGADGVAEAFGGNLI